MIVSLVLGYSATTIEQIMPGVDGIVLATTRLSAESIERLAARKPVVLINRAVDGVARVRVVRIGLGQILYDGTLAHRHSGLP